jgi:hypothetical protein
MQQATQTGDSLGVADGSIDELHLIHTDIIGTSVYTGKYIVMDSVIWRGYLWRNYAAIRSRTMRSSVSISSITSHLRICLAINVNIVEAHSVFIAQDDHRGVSPATTVASRSL